MSARSLLLVPTIAIALVLRAGGAEPAPPAASADDQTAGRPGPWGVPPRPDPAVLYDRFETFTAADGLPSDKVTCVLVRDDEVWVGTDHGLAVRRDGQWRTCGTADGLVHRFVTGLAADAGGDLWVSTLGGLSRVSGDRIDRYTQVSSGLMNDVVYDVAVDGPFVWAVTAAGASRLDTRTGTWRLFDNTNTVMNEPWTYSVAPANGWVFLGVWGSGVVQYEPAEDRWKVYRDPDGEMEIELVRHDGPIHDVTSFVACDGGLLWQATYFGLSRYDGKDWRSYQAHDSALPSDFINSVRAYGRWAFLATDKGFAAFDGTRCVTYRRGESGGTVQVADDGKVVEERSTATAIAHDFVQQVYPLEREVWVATSKGLSHGTAR